MKRQDFTAASVKKIVVVFCALFRQEDYVPGDDGVQERTSKDHVRLIACVATSSGPPLAAASDSTDGGRIILTKARAMVLKSCFLTFVKLVSIIILIQYLCSDIFVDRWLSVRLQVENAVYTSVFLLFLRVE